MQRRRLGGLEVSAVGLGCATMTPFYDEPDRDSAIDTLRCAREIGVDLLDSSDAYGRRRNEELIAHAVKGYRDKYVIASKFGNLRAPDGSPTSNGRPEYVTLPLASRAAPMALGEGSGCRVKVKSRSPASARLSAVPPGSVAELSCQKSFSTFNWPICR